MTDKAYWEWEKDQEPELIRDTYPLVMSQHVSLAINPATLLKNIINEADWAMRFPDPKQRKVAQISERFKSAGYKVKDGIVENAN